MSRPSHGHYDPRFIDVWGGIADIITGRPWGRDTMTLAYSCTKSVAAIVVLRLVEQGRIDLDTTVATYWPEFGANGKHDVTVRQVLAHRAGVPVVDTPLTFDDVLDGEPLLRALEAQKPLWQPGTAHGYHAITLGTILDEVVRRTTGSTIGATLRRDLGEPLGLDLWIGLPEAEHSRVATVLPADPRDIPQGGLRLPAQPVRLAARHPVPRHRRCAGRESGLTWTSRTSRHRPQPVQVTSTASSVRAPDRRSNR